MCHWGHGLKEFELLSPRREQSYKLPPCIDPLAFSFFPTGFFISSALFHLHLFFSPVLSPQISEPKTFQLWHLSKLLFLWPCCKGAQDAVPHGRVLHPGMWRSSLFWYGMCVSASSYGGNDVIFVSYLSLRRHQERTSGTLPRCWRTNSGPSATSPNTHGWATCPSRPSWKETTWKREAFKHTQRHTFNILVRTSHWHYAFPSCLCLTLSLSLTMT